MASSFNDSIVDNNSGGEDETKFDSFVFQEQYRHNETADESANNHRVVTSKRYKQGLQFDPLVIEEEILLEGENQHQKVIPTGFQQVLFFLKLSSFWFANALLLACLVTIVWPSQIAVCSHCSCCGITLYDRHLLVMTKRRLTTELSPH